MNGIFGGSVSAEDLHALADTHGTPYFLYDVDVIRARIAGLRSLLDGLVEIYFAVKANPNLELLRGLRDEAEGLDISSVGELEQALVAGYEADRLSFAGPGKSNEELGRSIEAGVGSISVESLRELESCVAIAKRLNRKANVVLRVNPARLNRNFGLKMGGKPIQFGIDQEELPEAVHAIANGAPHLAFKGVHVYAGSQCFEPAGIVEGAQDTFQIVRSIEATSTLVCGTVNLGGGFGVAHGSEGREVDVEAMARLLVPVLREFRSSVSVKRRVIFELGRYLASDAGVYVTRVISSKSTRGKSFFIVDGGLHHHLAAAGTFGAALRSNFPIRNLTHPQAPAANCSIAGPSCNPTDLLAVDVELPQPTIGDLIAVLRSGSYGFTASPLLFLGRPTAVELVRARGQTVVGRRSRTILDFN